MKIVRDKLTAVIVFALVSGSLAYGQSETGPVPAAPAESVKRLLDFRDTDAKFDINTLMNILRDRRHEGWVLAAYPDPKTKRPLIGAGFSLDLEQREHPQHDPFNTHTFVEPSSADLWQAAGLEPERLQIILARYHQDLQVWTAAKFRRRIQEQSLTPQLTEKEAMRLLRISVIQAVYNAKAYCRHFDQLTAPQQMALTQLVFQMGVNLEEFTQFLGTINEEAFPADARLINADYWRAVQGTLIQSQWARLYSARAASVIAMFDPAYERNPSGALRSIELTLRPTRHRGGRHSRAGVMTASLRKPSNSRGRAGQIVETRTRRRRS